MPMYPQNEPALSQALQAQRPSGGGSQGASSLAFPASPMDTAAPPSQMPSGATLSPRGDLGVLRQREALKVFHRKGAIVSASKYIPSKEKSK